MTWKVLRFWFLLVLVPVSYNTYLALQKLIGLQDFLPHQYEVLIRIMCVISLLFSIICFFNEFFDKNEHERFFGKKKYSFIWTYIAVIPIALLFHSGQVGTSLVCLVVMFMYEILRRKHNRFCNVWAYEEITKKARESKAERVELS